MDKYFVSVRWPISWSARLEPVCLVVVLRSGAEVWLASQSKTLGVSETPRAGSFLPFTVCRAVLPL